MGEIVRKPVDEGTILRGKSSILLRAGRGRRGGEGREDWQRQFAEYLKNSGILTRENVDEIK